MIAARRWSQPSQHRSAEQLAGPAGIEPATLSFEGCCSIQLSYGPAAMRTADCDRLSSPYTTGIGGHHGLTRLAAEGLSKLRHVLYHAYPELAGRVGIGLHLQPKLLGPGAATPVLPVAQEELLDRRIGALLGREINPLLPGIGQEGKVGQAQTAVVGGVLAQGQLAIDLHVIHGDKVAVLFHFAISFLGKPDVEDWMLSAQSDTEAYHGRLAKAQQLSEAAVRSAKHAEVPERAAEWRANQALREIEVGRAGQALKLATEALALSSTQELRLKVALVRARAGDAESAQKLADKLSQESPLDTKMQYYSLPTIRAASELGKNNALQAVQTLEVTRPYELGGPAPGITYLANLYPAYLRGEAYLKAGQGQAAAAEFQKVIDHPGIVSNFITGALAHLQLGRAQAMMGNKEAARRSYQDFFALWKEADTDLPILHAAKAEYAKLK